MLNWRKGLALDGVESNDPNDVCLVRMGGGDLVPITGDEVGDQDDVEWWLPLPELLATLPGAPEARG